MSQSLTLRAGVVSLVIFGLFVFWPLVHNVYLGFFRNPPFPGLPSKYVGFDQYKDVLTSETFVDSVKTTLILRVSKYEPGVPIG
jgi:ABC-type sugar transport system permease subunit